MMKNGGKGHSLAVELHFGSVFAVWALVWKYPNKCLVTETELLRDIHNPPCTLSHKVFCGPGTLKYILTPRSDC